MPPGENGWNEWSKHVLAELERLDDSYGKIADEMNKIRVEIATLKVKSGLWGLAGAAIPIAVMIAVQMMLRAK